MNKIGNIKLNGKILQQKKKKQFIFNTRINLDNLVSIKAVKNWTKNLVRIDDATESSHGDNLLKIAKMTNNKILCLLHTMINLE